MKNKMIASAFGAFLAAASFAFSVPEIRAEEDISSLETEAPASEKKARRTTSSRVTGDELVQLAWTDLSGLRGALLHGADPNARTSVGDFPIIRLAFGGNVEAVKILLDFNAKTTVINTPEQSTTAGTLRALTSYVADREKMDLKNFLRIYVPFWCF